MHVRAARFPEEERAPERVQAAGTDTRSIMEFHSPGPEEVDRNTDYSHGRAWRIFISHPTVSAGGETDAQRW